MGFLSSISYGESATNRPLVGAIRWDGQSGGDAWGVYAKETNALSPAKWHWRLPFYATEPTSSSCTMNGNSQAIMDAEIAYAKDAHIDYWAFCYYPESVHGGLEYAFNLYSASATRNDVNWCIIIPGDYAGYFNSSLIAEFVSRFQQSNYQTVFTNRPLIYFFGTETATLAADFAALRTAAQAAGLGNPYVVSMDAANQGSIIGADAVSRYINGVNNGGSYAAGAAAETAIWDSGRTAGKKVIPTVTSGKDARPRIEAGEPTYGGAAWWEQTPQPAEFANHLTSALRWIRQYPATAEANSVLIYSWNEFSEGGTLCPLLIPGTTHGVNSRMLDIAKSVITGAYQPEINRIFNGTFCADGIPATSIAGWTTSSTNGTAGAAITAFTNQADSYGIFHLVHQSPSPFSVTTYQQAAVNNGSYTLSANIRASGGMSTCAMTISGHGGSNIVISIPPAANWTTISKAFDVSSGGCSVSFISDAQGGQWLTVDDVKLVGMPPLIQNGSFEVPSAAAGWYVVPGEGMPAEFAWSNNFATGAYVLANSSAAHFTSASEGAQALLLGGSIWQPVTVPPGAAQTSRYQVSFDLLQDKYYTGGTNGGVRVEWLDGSNVLASADFDIPLAQNIWERHTLAASSDVTLLSSPAIRFKHIYGVV